MLAYAPYTVKGSFKPLRDSVNSGESMYLNDKGSRLISLHCPTLTQLLHNSKRFLMGMVYNQALR